MAKRRLRPSVIGQPVTTDQKSRLTPTHGAENTQQDEFTAPGLATTVKSRLSTLRLVG